MDTHLAETDQQAEKVCFQLVKQMATQEGITDQLKTQNQIQWIGRMNSIRSQVEEIISTKCIHS